MGTSWLSLNVSCWRERGTTGTVTTSSSGPGEYLRQEASPSATSNCFQSCLNLCNGGWLHDLSDGILGDCIIVWHTWDIMGSFIWACSSCGGGKETFKVHGIDGNHNSASALIFAEPLQYTILKLYSCMAKAQQNNIPFIYCSASNWKGAWSL